MYYNERQSLALALIRFINHESGYPDNKKSYLIGLCKKFQDWGISRLSAPQEREDFMELLSVALD